MRVKRRIADGIGRVKTAVSAATAAWKSVKPCIDLSGGQCCRVIEIEITYQIAAGISGRVVIVVKPGDNPGGQD
jgi:hypothetical protein